MKPSQGTRSLIHSLYPGRETLIDLGFSEYPPFLELCEDYQRCVAALEDLRRPGSSGTPERVREYEELLIELAGELEGCLEDLSRGRS